MSLAQATPAQPLPMGPLPIPGPAGALAPRLTEAPSVTQEQAEALQAFVETQRLVRQSVFGDDAEPTLFWQVSDASSVSDPILYTHHGETALLLIDEQWSAPDFEAVELDAETRLVGVDIVRGELFGLTATGGSIFVKATVSHFNFDIDGAGTIYDGKLVVHRVIAGQARSQRALGQPCGRPHPIGVWMPIDVCGDLYDPQNLFCAYPVVDGVSHSAEETCYELYLSRMNEIDSRELALVAGALGSFMVALWACTKAGLKFGLIPGPLSWAATVGASACGFAAFAGYLIALRHIQDQAAADRAQALQDLADCLRAACADQQ
jgi:hypothetical protein